MHLGGDSFSDGVDVDRECYPAGQGVGAITELVPAGELVRRFVAEAERTLDRLSGLALSSREGPPGMPLLVHLGLRSHRAPVGCPGL